MYGVDILDDSFIKSDNMMNQNIDQIENKRFEVQ